VRGIFLSLFFLLEGFGGSFLFTVPFLLAISDGDGPRLMDPDAVFFSFSLSISGSFFSLYLFFFVFWVF